MTKRRTARDVSIGGVIVAAEDDVIANDKARVHPVGGPFPYGAPN